MTDKYWTERNTQVSDAEQIALHACLIEQETTRREAYAPWVRRTLASGHYIGRFALYDNTVIAGAGAVLLDWGPTRANLGGRMARIANVFTVEAHRSKGIARTLIVDVMRQCEVLGIREFNLGSTPDARGLYQSLGFSDYPAEMRRRV